MGIHGLQLEHRERVAQQTVRGQLLPNSYLAAGTHQPDFQPRFLPVVQDMANVILPPDADVHLPNRQKISRY